jgi:hypothetical protein
MNTDAVEGLLASLRPQATDITCELGRRADAGYLRLFKPTEPERWAVVSSPGDRWLSLDVDGDFSLDHFAEGMTDDEMSRGLHRYVELALLYLRGEVRQERSGKLRLQVLKIETTEGEVVLRRSVAANLRGLIQLGRP